MSDSTPIPALVVLAIVAWLALAVVIWWQALAERKRDQL